MYKSNDKGGLLELKNGVFSLIVTEKMLSEWDENMPIEGVVAILSRHYPEISIDLSIELDLVKTKEEAKNHVIYSSCYLSDRFFIARAWFMAVETLANRDKSRFRLRFHYMEGNE